jgi:tRNA(adenine34) deaminase
MVRRDEYWMKAALRLAAKAAEADETPVGAVVVWQGRIIGRGRNQRETRQDATLHAEISAIRQACRRLGSWRLDGATLYVTLEPCLMCAGAIIQSRISRLVYGPADPKAGACGSLTNVFDLRFNHPVIVEGGLLAAAGTTLLQDFFQKRRQMDKAAGSRTKRRDQAGQDRQNSRSARKRGQDPGAAPHG